MIGSDILLRLENKFQKKRYSYGIIAVIAIIAYCNSFTVPFVLDDFGSISNNYAIHHLFDFVALWKFYANRIVLYFTLSLDYAVHDNGVEMYHVVNLVIHIFNGILFYKILKKILERPYFRSRLLSLYTNAFSVIAAVLFVCHPIQVNAVTYIVQRTASLAATFYLLAILFYINYRLQDRIYQLLLTFLFTVIAMFTKENTITIPFMLLFIEIMFFLKDGKTPWYKRILILLPLFATVPIIPFTNVFLQGHSQSDPGVSFKASTSMDRFQYFYTELNVILLYIKLMFIPDRQNFDYSNDFPVSPTIWDNYSYVSLLILLLIGCFAIFTYKRNRLVSFGILWFFAGLAVESSFISIKDVYFEHRLYFPCAGFAMFIVGMAAYERKRRLSKKPPLHVEEAPPADEASSAITGEMQFTSVVSPEDAVEAPVSENILQANDKKAAEPMLTADLYTSEKDAHVYTSAEDACVHTSEEHSGMYTSAGNACASNEGSSFQSTIIPRARYLFKNPILILLVFAFLMVPIYTGLTIKRNYIYGDSIRLWSDVISKAPGSDRAHCVLATSYLNAYSEKDKNTEYLDLAEQEFKKTIDMNYSNSTAHCNLSKVYLLKQEYQKCIDEAERTLNITKSEYADYNMGFAYKKLGNTDKALEAFHEGYDFNKHSTFILKALGDTYYETGDYQNAKRFFKEYIENNSRFNCNDARKKLKLIEQELSKSQKK